MNKLKRDFRHIEAAVKKWSNLPQIDLNFHSITLWNQQNQQWI